MRIAKRSRFKWIVVVIPAVAILTDGALGHALGSSPISAVSESMVGPQGSSLPTGTYQRKSGQHVPRNQFAGKVVGFDTPSAHEALASAARRIADAFSVIKQNYVDLIEEEKVVTACRAELRSRVDALPHLLHADRVYSVDPREGPEEIERLMSEVARENPGFAEWSGLADACIGGMLAALDKHSAFLDEEAFERLTVGSHRPWGGIGVELAIADGSVKVVAAITGGPADRAGVKGEDIITKIEDHRLQGATLGEVVKRLRGKPGSTVRITISRSGELHPLELELVREIIRVRSVRGRMLAGGYLYIRIAGFASRTADLVAAALQTGYRNDLYLRGVILDLRNNPGGVLRSCIGVAAAFLPQTALVVTTRGRRPDSARKFFARPQDYGRARSKDPLEELPALFRTIPVMVIVNRASAACAEIVAAALQDHHRAKLLGERTFGRGTVQTIMPFLGRNTAMKITTARFFRPSGDAIESLGVTPDIVLENVSGASPSFGTADDAALAAAIKALSGARAPAVR